MSMNLVGIAGVPYPGTEIGCTGDMSGKLVGVGVDEPLTPDQTSALRWTAAALLGLAAIGLWWMENRRHA